MDEVRIVMAEATGVASVEHDGIYVNETNMLSDIRESLENIPYKHDYSGAFAARVKIEIELIGDMEQGAENE